MILGLLLVMVVSLVLYVQGPLTRPNIPLVPAEVRPVYDIIDNCQRIIGEEAVRRLGAGGGYLTLPSEIDNSPSAHLSLDDTGVMKVPLWHYDGRDRTPSITFMEAQLADELQYALPGCIENFSALRDRFTVEQEGPLIINVTLGENDVIIRTDYPLRWQEADRVQRHQDYVTILNAPLVRMWQLANDTMRAENAGTFVENITIDLMSSDPAIPMTGMTFDCDPQRWRMPEVRAELQDVLRINLPAVRVRNTNYLPFEQPERVYERLRGYSMEDIMAGRLPQNVPDDAYEYFRLFWDVGTERSTLRAGLRYDPNWGMALSASPNDNGILESRVSRGGGGYLDAICVNTFHFTYDAYYPVLFTVRSTEAFDQRGLTFQMAFPVQIRDNAPERTHPVVRSIENIGAAEGFCENLGSTLVDIRARGIEEGTSSASELDGVTFTLSCITRQCDIGSSVADGGIYRLRTLLPAGCANPTIVAHKDGYIDARGQVIGTSLELTLRRLISTPIVILKHPYDLTNGGLGDAVPLQAGENVSIRIAPVNSSEEWFVNYPVNDTLPLIEGRGSYDIDVLLSRQGELTGGYVASGVRLESGGTLELHVLEGRPIDFTDEHRNKLAGVLYGTTYQTRLAPVTR